VVNAGSDDDALDDVRIVDTGRGTDRVRVSVGNRHRDESKKERHDDACHEPRVAKGSVGDARCLLQDHGRPIGAAHRAPTLTNLSVVR